jgi:hypothetical protein
MFKHASTIQRLLVLLYNLPCIAMSSTLTMKFQVYFLWICPSHRHFEWFIEVLRDVEKKDVTNVLEIHIFITQFFHKFDLRTTMLVSCRLGCYTRWACG